MRFPLERVLVFHPDFLWIWRCCSHFGLVLIIWSTTDILGSSPWAQTICCHIKLELPMASIRLSHSSRLSDQHELQLVDQIRSRKRTEELDGKGGEVGQDKRWCVPREWTNSGCNTCWWCIRSGFFEEKKCYHLGLYTVMHFMLTFLYPFLCFSIWFELS